MQNDSPVERFVKVTERPSRSKAATFVTGTPFPLVSKRSALEKISPNIDIKSDMKINKNEATDLYPKRQSNAQNSTISTTPKSSNYNAKRHKIELNNLANDSTTTCQAVVHPKDDNLEDKENCKNSSPPSQYITGDLVKACSIM